MVQIIKYGIKKRTFFTVYLDYHRHTLNNLQVSFDDTFCLLMFSRQLNQDINMLRIHHLDNGHTSESFMNAREQEVPEICCLKKTKSISMMTKRETPQKKTAGSGKTRRVIM